MARSGLGTSGRDAACSRLGTRLSDEARRLKVIHPCLTACERAAVAIVVMRAQRHGGGELDKHARQSSWSAAPAERVNVASEVVRRQLWSWPSVEARPVLACAELNALPCLAHVRWAHSYRLRRLCIGKLLIPLGGVSR